MFGVSTADEFTGGVDQKRRRIVEGGGHSCDVAGSQRHLQPSVEAAVQAAANARPETMAIRETLDMSEMPTRHAGKRDRERADGQPAATRHWG
ncbi:MAG TPA: hypothetical protein VGA66_12740 [Mycobacterium sp.]